MVRNARAAVTPVARLTAATVLVAVLLVIVIVPLPTWIVRSSEFRGAVSARVQRQNEVRSVGVEALGGLILVIGAVYAARTYALSRHSQQVGRIASAVDRTGTGGRAAIGGLLDLQRMASESPQYEEMIVELLAIYVRMDVPITAALPASQLQAPTLPLELQTTLSVISRHHRTTRRSRRLNLSYVALDGADLEGAGLRGVNLQSSRLRMARLTDADLRTAWLQDIDATGANALRARLRGALLNNADLTNANFEGADLRGCPLAHAKLAGSFLARAKLQKCDLTRATGDTTTMLYEARLCRADLTSAEFVGSYFEAADLRRAALVGANLTSAVLMNADLRRSDFTMATLRNADFRQADCRGACFSGADLRGAVFSAAMLRGADLSGIRRDPADPPLS